MCKHKNFFSNDVNKNRFIRFLRDALEEAQFATKQAEEDADTMIVNTAIEVANKKHLTVIIREDTDLLVILTQMAYPLNLNNIYYNIPGKNTSKEKIYTINSFKPESKHLIAFLHAFCRCDTTSGFYQIGKNKIVSVIENDPNLQQLAKCFY